MMNLTNRFQKNKALDIKVTSFYLPNQSSPEDSRYVFAYTISIKNISNKPVKLLRRHWLITDGNQSTQEVNGFGVVGEQPMIRPKEIFEYTSGSVIETPVGCMEGSYIMATEDGSEFDVAIPVFSLTNPETLH